MLIKKTLAIIFFTIISMGVFAQSTSDAGLWSTFTIQKDLTKKFTLAIDQECRLKENYSRVNLFYTNIGLSYKIRKGLKVELAYRSIEKIRLDKSVSFRNRIQLDLTYKIKGEKLTFSQRLRLQTEVQDYFTSVKGKLSEQFLRYKMDLKFDLGKKLFPYISTELRYQISSPRGQGPDFDFGWHRIRNIAGVEYEINKKNIINLYYLVQSEFGLPNPENIYITGIQYILEL